MNTLNFHNSLRTYLGFVSIIPSHSSLPPFKPFIFLLPHKTSECGVCSWHFSPPQPSLNLSCLPLKSSKLLHILKGVFSVRKPIPLLDDLRIQESSIHEINIGQDPAISVSPGLIIFKPNFFPFNHSFGELTSFFSEILDRFFWMLCLRG